MPGSDKAKENAFIAKIVHLPRREVIDKDKQFDKAILLSATHKSKIVPNRSANNRSSIA